MTGTNRLKRASLLFLDLKRAFETVDRNRLIKKLSSMGINGNELKWFESYLEKRRQKTKFQKRESNEKEISIGIPQGTQLSVILFILYINDIVHETENASIIMFADDTVLKIRGKDIDSTIRQMNSDLEKVLNWLNVNKLKLNVDKTKWMIFGYKKNDIQEKILQIDNIKIERVNTIKYLGIIISENLKMEEQVNKIVSKNAKKVNALYRISKKLTLDARKTVYNTIIRPNFDYCSTLYLNTSREQINAMQAIQNRAMRILSQNVKYFIHHC